MESCFAACSAFQRSSEECFQNCEDGITPDYELAAQSMLNTSMYESSYSYDGYMGYGGSYFSGAFSYYSAPIDERNVYYGMSYYSSGDWSYDGYGGYGGYDGTGSGSGSGSGSGR
jgi:hypothetical protein